MAELTPAQLLTAKVPAGTADNPGVYDSNKDPNVEITGKYSSIFIESIDGADNIDLELYDNSIIHSDLKDIKSNATYGMSNPDKLPGTFNRVVFKNSTNVVVTVKIRINNYGMFYYSNSGGGGGGVATHVKIDGTAQVAGTVDVGKMPKVDVTFPTSIKTEITNTPTVKIDGAVDIAGIVGVSGFSEDASIGIRGAVQTTMDTSKTPLNVAFDGSAIKVVPAPSPGLYAGNNPPVGKTLAKIVSARAKRITLSVQSNYNNAGNIYIRDAATHSLCAIIPPGASWSAPYSGELWANADSDGYSVQVMELYN